MPDTIAATGFSLVLSENGRVREERALAGECVRIGRRPFNEIALDDLTVSGEHALIRIGPDGCLIRDLKSRNGTYVNGRPVSECPLADGDCIDIGIYRLRVNARHGDEPTRPAAGADTRIAGAALEYVAGVHRGIVQRLDRSITRVSGGDSQAAAIVRRKNGFVLTRLEGMTPARLNDVAVGPGASPLADGDLIELGETRIRFRLRG